MLFIFGKRLLCNFYYKDRGVNFRLLVSSQEASKIFLHQMVGDWREKPKRLWGPCPDPEIDFVHLGISGNRSTAYGSPPHILEHCKWSDPE